MNEIFDFDDDKGSQRMLAMLRDPDVSEITANGHGTVFYTGSRGKMMIREKLFAGEAQYVSFLNHLLGHTDAGVEDISEVVSSVVEGSFTGAFRGSIHICTREVTRGEPVLTIRKQPIEHITLDEMVEQRMLTEDMKEFLVAAVRGRANILLSGGSGAGKTTFARALSAYIDPAQRVLTCEEIDELHMEERLPNVVALTTHRVRDQFGRILRETNLEDLVREALRMRADRIWVGETRGKEAYALVKACNSGHDGSLTTIHADDGGSAVKQAITYVMEGGVVEEVARDQVARAFHLVIQIAKVSATARKVVEITELEAAREKAEQRRNLLWSYDIASDGWVRHANMTNRLRGVMHKHGVNY